MGEDNEWDEKKIIIIKKNRLPQPHMGRKAGPDNMHNTACLLLIDSQQQVSKCWGACARRKQIFLLTKINKNQQISGD